MALHHNPRIVTDGLVLALDAGDVNSYPGTGTTWKDLSGNGNDGTLTNGPTFDGGNQGSIMFDGSNDYAEVLDNPSLDLPENKTLSCWVNMGGNSSGCGITGKSNSTVRGMALGYGWNGNGFMALAWNSSNTPFIVKDLSRDIGKWVFLTAVQNGSTRTLYVWDNLGIRTSNSTSGTHSWDNTQSLMIGNANNGNNSAPANTKINIVYVYDRALTSQEVLQNYNATKTRFGL